MTKLATIEMIHSIQPHPNKEVEKLEIAKVKEWPVVVPKGEYREGQLVIFIQIDSIVPSDHYYFKFMERQKYRVWNARFKGAPSQGLVCPLSLLFTKVPVAITVNVGDNMTDLLGITKYEKALDTSVCGDAKGSFPTNLISITDEDNLLNYSETLNELRGEECYLTVKADGSSMTVIYDAGEVRVCSRRLEQKEGTGFWNIASKYDLPNKLRAAKMNIAIQAEGCGGKIQGNPMGLAETSMFVFNVKETDTGRWYGYYEIVNICSSLGIPTVQLLCEPFVFDDTWTIDRLQELANKVTYTGADGKIRKGEGIVLRPVTPKYSPTLGKSLSVKIINQEYKQ